ncbi:Golgi pH regulator, conserved domain protein [Kalmanozyma brasiliensis GHG001]|uniref:G protein-coupled receptor 89 n=1 Tax=Kalmanozyma brasiliensis (strain GHG001) TaxID=1365824 RepID=V5EPK0_KALBG|nr:Golgi pH regulator, conserved domain protein [Kalmanozyma brasiliensis GHG001]EST07020.1 Golgi pH regulator, conserved domain protein [Kalmanozyma brasiliensis GHG001]
MIDYLFILAIKLALYLSARAALPFLFGQARHASLDVSTKPASTLPTPATAQASTNSHPLHSDSIHDDDDTDDGLSATDTSPFLAGKRGSARPSWTQFRASLLAPVRIRNTSGALDLASVSALLFSFAFEESASLYVAVLLETAGFSAGNGTALRKSWRFSLAAVQALAIVFIPLAVCLLFTYRSNSSTPLPRRIAYLLIPFLPWLVLFFKVPLPAALSDARSGAGIFDGLMARTAVIGVTFIAVLSGSAALQAAWEAFEQFKGKSQRSPSASDIVLAQESFQKTCADLASTKANLARLENETPETDARWSVSSLWGGSSRSREIKSLKSEIFGLSSIAAAMRDDLDRMTALQHKAQLESTPIGKVWILIGWIWAVYCAFRIALSLLNLLILGYRDTAPPDFISLLVAEMIRIFDVDLDVDAWTKQVSLLFVGILIWGRIGSVLSYLGSAFRAAGTGVSSSFLVLFLAEIMTVYLLATLIQLRSSLPASVANPTPVLTPDQMRRDTVGDTTTPPLIATLPSFQVVFGSLFDSAFLLAAAVTAGWKYLVYMQRPSSGDGGALFGASMR